MDCYHTLLVCIRIIFKSLQYFSSSHILDIGCAVAYVIYVFVHGTYE